MKKYLFLGFLLIVAKPVVASDSLEDLNNSLASLNNIIPPTLSSLPSSAPAIATQTPSLQQVLSYPSESAFGWKTYMAVAAAGTALYLSQTKFKNFYTPLTSLSQLTTDQNDIEKYTITLENYENQNGILILNNKKTLSDNTIEKIIAQLNFQPLKINTTYKCSGYVNIKGRIGSRKLAEHYFTTSNDISVQDPIKIFIEPFIRASYATIDDIPKTLQAGASYYLTISCQDFRHCYLPSKTVTANSYQVLMEEFFVVLKTYIEPNTHYTLKLQISLDSPTAQKRLFITPCTIQINGNQLLSRVYYDKNNGYDGTRMNFWTGQGYLAHRKYVSQCQGSALQSFWNTNESLQSYTGYHWNNNALVKRAAENNEQPSNIVNAPQRHDTHNPSLLALLPAQHKCSNNNNEYSNNIDNLNVLPNNDPSSSSSTHNSAKAIYSASDLSNEQPSNIVNTPQQHDTNENFALNNDPSSSSSTHNSEKAIYSTSDLSKALLIQRKIDVITFLEKELSDKKSLLSIQQGLFETAENQNLIHALGVIVLELKNKIEILQSNIKEARIELSLLQTTIND